jgi:hypothetical protein
MLHSCAKVLEKLQAYVPLMQSLVWPAFLTGAAIAFRRPILSCAESIMRRVDKGAAFKAGPIELAALREMEYVPPRESEADESQPKDWVTERTAIYKNNSGLFLTHILEPSSREGQRYDISIYLIRHRTTDMSDIAFAEFFFGHMWGNQVFEEHPKNGLFGVRTSAYGPFLCTCRVHLKDGSTVKLHRYIDFEMGKAVA